MYQPQFSHLHEIDFGAVVALDDQSRSQDLRGEFIAATTLEDASAIVAEALLADAGDQYRGDGA